MFIVRTKNLHLRNPYHHGSIAISLIILLFSAFVLFWSRAELREAQALLVENQTAQAPLYLPSARHVRLITLGYNKFFSNILWFNTLNYFGKHYDTDKDFRWLGHMCELVSSLDPKARHVYEFCATLLSWVAQEPEKSAVLLDRAVQAEPDYWRYLYLRGFNYWYFLEQKELAEQDLVRASKLPDAPPFLASLASRMMVSKDEISTAIGFLKNLIENTNDETAKKALRKKLKLAYVSRDIRLLRKIVLIYQAQNQQELRHFKQLVQAGMLKGIPLDPFGKPYFIDNKTGDIRSRSGKKGLEFFGKTAKTGLAEKFK